MNLADLIRGLPITLRSDCAPDARICDLTEDSQTVMPGSLFVARRGGAHDGRAFVPAAIGLGAAAILTDDPELPVPGHARRTVAVAIAGNLPHVTALLAERFYGNPASRLALVGVTGTNGKTTVSYLVHQLLNAAGVRCGLIGTVVVDDGVETAPATFTTPPSIEVSRTLARMLEAGCRAAAIEISSHALVQSRADGLALDAAVFTNLTGDHLDYHHTMDAYTAAKSRLFTLLDPSRKPGAAAVANADDPACDKIVAVSPVPIIRCHLVPLGAPTAAPPAPVPGAAAEVVCATVTIVEPDLYRTRLTLEGPWGRIDTTSPFPGGYNAMNLLEAVAAAYSVAKLDAEALAALIPHLKAPPGRLEPVTAPDDALAVFVDYAHTDDALRNVLTVLREAITPRLSPGKLWLVFGCGGDRDRTKRPRMGAVAAQLADKMVVTSDNPRSEDPRAIIDDILGGVPWERHADAVIEPDREAAISRAIARASPGDTIVITGKGHEDYQLLPDASGGVVRREFDDRLVARAALARRGIGGNPAAANPTTRTRRPRASEPSA